MSQLERENLEAHVDLCAARYQVLEEKMTNLQSQLDRVHQQTDTMNTAMNDLALKIERSANTNTKVIIGSAGTVIAGLLSTIVVIIANL